MGFQNENKLKVGASVKATINNKMVEAKVISIGFNRVTLRSEKGQQGSYVFNSDKFLKWFNKVPLTEHMRLHAENKKADILDGVKVVTSGPSVKDRTSTPKEKESKFKLGFDFADQSETSFLLMADFYANEERKKRLGILFAPMLYDTRGYQASMVIIHALTFAQYLKHHSDHEWNTMIENRNIDEAFFDSFDDMPVTDLTLFIRCIEAYAKNLKRPDGNIGMTLEEWGWVLPKNQKEAKFVTQLLCDGGINKYGLSCAGLGENLLKDIELNLGLATRDEIDEYFDNLENEGEAENLES
ncbi:hypothetical protein HpCOL14_09270 [Helicobacter pylori]